MEKAARLSTKSWWTEHLISCVLSQGFVPKYMWQKTAFLFCWKPPISNKFSIIFDNFLQTVWDFLEIFFFNFCTSFCRVSFSHLSEHLLTVVVQWLPALSHVNSWQLVLIFWSPLFFTLRSFTSSTVKTTCFSGGGPSNPTGCFRSFHWTKRTIEHILHRDKKSNHARIWKKRRAFMNVAFTRMISFLWRGDLFLRPLCRGWKWCPIFRWVKGTLRVNGFGENKGAHHIAGQYRLSTRRGSSWWYVYTECNSPKNAKRDGAQKPTGTCKHPHIYFAAFEKGAK